MTQLGELHHALGEYTAAQHCYDEALALWRSTGGSAREAWTLFQMGVLASTIGALPRSEALFGESLALYRDLDEPWGVATVLMQLAGVVMLYNDYDRAAELLDEAGEYLRDCLRIYRQIGYKSGALIAFEALAAVCAAQGYAARAVGWLAVGDQLRPLA